MDLVLSKQASKALARIQPKQSHAILAALKAVAADPYRRHANVETLKGYPDGFRLRHGIWRAVYVVDRARRRMFVEAIKPRGDVYK
ncbi:MAG: type II toxin-antitoxin system RelE/ParE family toxin [Alphaproteobacteria bacterium]|nr:type II toxin-antitoxin system RelE/ParE family toxin [Alphaproteobacteria bacterium]